MHDLLMGMTFWAGTEESWQTYLAQVAAITPEMMAEAEKRAYERDREDRAPRLFSKSGNVATISISGPLNNSSSWMNPYMGYTGYPEIRAALVHAAHDAEVKAIVLAIKSGGGAVSGVADTGGLISMIDKKVKPVHTYSDGMIASAAYWLGSSARSIAIDQVTEIGSIGVVQVHQDMTKRMEKEGVTTTVIRAGEFKALGNPYETLSPEAKKIMQAQVDEMYKLFAGHVAEARGVTYAVADQKMGQGRMFIGQSGVEAGLADKVASFDSFLGQIQGGIDKKNAAPKYGANPSENTLVKKALTEQDIAAIAAGAAVLVPTDKSAEEIAAEVVAAEAAADEAAAAEAAAEAAKVAAKPAEPNAVVDLLKSQLEASQAKVLDLSMSEIAMKTAVTNLEAAVEKMRPIVQNTLANMRVAMGGTRTGIEALNDDSLLAEFASANVDFLKKFKAGGVSGSPVTDIKPKAEVAGDDSFRKARIAATRR